jgi:hypothetical protein
MPPVTTSNAGALKPAVLFFQGFKPFQIVARHPGVLGFPIVVAGFTHPVRSAESRRLGSSLSFFKHGDDLFPCVFLAYYSVLPFVLL